MECLHIVDVIQPPHCNGKVLLWDRFSDNDAIDSILDLQEQFFLKTRAEFLYFVHNFGEHSINGQPLRDYLRLSDGFSLWWLTRIFERHPAFFGHNLFEIFKLRALEHLLNSMQPVSVHLYSTNVPLVRTMHELCNHLCIPFELHIPAQKPQKHPQQKSCQHTACSVDSSTKGRLCSTSSLVRALTKFRRNALVNRITNAVQITCYAWRWWRNVRSQFPKEPKGVKRLGLLLGTWFPNLDENAAKQGIFRSKYWEKVHDIISEYGKPVHWFFIYGDSTNKVTENIRLRDIFLRNEPDHVDMTFLEECISPWGALKAWLQAMRVAWNARGILQYLPAAMRWPNSCLNVYPLLAGIWKDSTQGEYLMRMCFTLEGIRRYCALIGPQETVVTSSELQFWERLLFQEQRNLGCRRIYAAQHSVIRDADFRFFVAPDTWSINDFCHCMPDKFFCNSDAAYLIMHNNGFPEDRLGMLEATRFIGISTIIPPQHKSHFKRILVVTSYFTQNALRTLTVLAQAMRQSSHPLLKNVVIKPHPYLPVDDMLAQLFDIPPKQVSGSIEFHLTQDTVVIADSATSVGLLACYRELPLIECTLENNFDMSITQVISGRVSVKNAKELIKALQDIKPTKVNNYFCITPGMPRWNTLLSGSNSLTI